MKPLTLIAGIAILISCAGEGSQESNVDYTGLDASVRSVECNDPFKLDSVLFANGKYQYLLSGRLTVNDTVSSFLVMLDQSPFDENPKVISTSFPVETDSDSLECVITTKYNVVKLTWRTKKASLTIQNSVISEH